MTDVTAMFGAYITLNKLREFLSPGNTQNAEDYIHNRFFSILNWGEEYWRKSTEPVMLHLKNNIHVYFHDHYEEALDSMCNGAGVIFVGVPSEPCYFDDDGVMRITKFSMNDLKKDLMEMFKLDKCNITYTNLDECAKYGYLQKTLADYPKDECQSDDEDY